MEIIEAGKKIGSRVIVGGHHVTGTRHQSGEGYETVIGPGEAPFARLLTGDMSIPAPGHMDDIPIPDHGFGRLAGHKPTIMTSRGCSFKCSFCSPKTMWEKIQFHSARRVVDEIQQIRESFPNMKRLSIWDDLFAAKQSRVREIHNLMREEGIKIKMNSSMRAELVTESNARLWKSLGLTRLGIGGESGSNRILKRLKSPAASVEINQNALDIMHEHGMAIGTGIIFGCPTETEEDVIATYEWLLKNYRAGKLMNHEVNILTPMPGTPVWFEAERNGHVCEYDNFDWSRLRYHSLTSQKTWMGLREKVNSVYLNEATLPQETLYEMIEHYENKIRWCSPAQIVRGAKRTVERWLT